jgi:UDP-GlcNAc:undecaprenyl-phosphate GlcNAc-1-phosphate transferase
MSFFVGIIFIYLLKRLVLRYKILNPRGVPLIGGIAMGLSFLIASRCGFLISANLSSQAVGIMMASAIMLIWGVIDDLQELSVLAKFLVQIIATTLLIFFGVKTQIILVSPLINLIITFVWVLAITNAFNHLDIMDGLACGTAIIVGLSFFIIAHLNGDIKSAILSLALVGGAFSFLIHNLPPARIYMGNSGSHFLGFILAAIALAISYAPLERKIALFSPLLILGFPIFDTTFLILMRLKQHRPVFRKSNDHIALRFLKLGFSKSKTLFFILLLCFFFALSGVVLSKVSNILGIVIIAAVILASIMIAYRISKVSIDESYGVRR